MPFRPEKPIVLVGLMGAGKSTIGRRLASQLGLEFVDSDVEIERAFNLDIPGIFERFGEARFRDCESRLVAGLIEGPPRVIAAGGGVFVGDAVRHLILKKCHSVWLEADAKALADRIGSGSDRPLVAGRDPGVVLAELAEQRSPLYAMAHIRVRSDDAPVDLIVNRIAAALAETQE